MILILSGFSALRCGATVYQSDGSEADVRAKINGASAGDIVTIPTGTFLWAAPLSVNKAITLKGNSTMPGAGTSTPTRNDLTIIQDALPRPGVYSDRLVVLNTGTAGGRITMEGITFTTPGSLAKIVSAAYFYVNDDSGIPRFRITNCHFDHIKANSVLRTNTWAYGVVDHCIFDLSGWSFASTIEHKTYGGKTWGDGAWADYPWYGTNKFFFFETNSFFSTNTVNPLADSSGAGRVVVRHNYCHNVHPSTHGTEDRRRGVRAFEVYDNTFDYSVPSGGFSLRSGTGLIHDNIFTGIKPRNGKLGNGACYRYWRYIPDWINGTLGPMALGDNVWDMNDTDGNGHYTWGQPPHLFESGTIESTTLPSGNATITLTDSTKTWTTNQWKGYSVRDVTSKHGSFIQSNDAHTLTCFLDNAAGNGPKCTVGGRYEIHRVLQALDNVGTGKGDLISGDQAKSVNVDRGNIARYPNNQPEPVICWRNITSDGTDLKWKNAFDGIPGQVDGVHWHNLGKDMLADTTPDDVRTSYGASINGQAYTGPYVYPHPLVTGAPIPLPSATSRSRQHFQKKAKRAKKKKRWPKKSTNDMERQKGLGE
jgi:hypothetical protein